MVYLSAPTSQYDVRKTYCTAYREILAKRRRAAASTPSAVVLLVALEVDALCACRMLASLLTRDSVLHRIEPVSGYPALVQLKEQLKRSTELHTLVLLNMGSMLDLASEDWFGDYDTRVKVHVIDSRRPQSLPNLFGIGERAERIVVWDDGNVQALKEERKAYEATMFDSSGSEDSGSDEEEDLSDEEDEDEDEEGPPRQKRRINADPESRQAIRAKRREERDEKAQYVERLDKYYMSGTNYGQSAAGIIYILATGLERSDNTHLWLAILGLTYQYINSRIKRARYEQFHSILSDEVARLNTTADRPKTLTADDTSIRTSEELRFTLLRHWNLYDAMYHSAYVTSRLRIWNEKGRKQLQSLLAKMGFSLQQCQQSYAHMDMDLKRDLRNKFDNYAPEYGLVEPSYPSFTRSFGFRVQPLCAADVVEGVSALLEAATGVKLEMESAGGKGGGEWFSGSKAWSLDLKTSENKENIPAAGTEEARRREAEEDPDNERNEDNWWVENFWHAYDALGTNVNLLRNSLPLAMVLQQAIVRQGTSLIAKRSITQLTSFRMATIKEGPDLQLFSHPSTLSRLALWLVDATREWVPAMAVGRKKNILPFVIACFKETEATYMVVGVTGAKNFGDVKENTFNLAFLEARDRSGARTRQATFDTSVVEVNKDDLHKFIETLAMRAS